MLSNSGKGRHQKGFINRENEIQLVQDAFKALRDSERPLSTPIIDFFGVGGIGKTSILQQIKNLCDDEKISYIWLDASASKSQFVRSISRQMKKYTLTREPITTRTGESFSANSVQAIKKLLAKKPPVVALLDSVDSEQQSDWIKTMLRDVIDDTNLCVVLASKQKLSFERDWVMASKLMPFQLKPLNQANSELYLGRAEQNISTEIKQLLFEWTHGYPLAMNVVLQAIKEETFDFGRNEDQRRLIDIIVKRVINEEILAKIESTDLAEYWTSLELLSFPRRFNLLITQELFPKFAPSVASDFKNKLAYMALPGKLNHNTNVLYWDPLKAGLTIDQAVRNIFLLPHRVERSAFFYEVHAFLAKKNEELVNAVTGTDRMRYLREYLYHSAYREDADLPAIIEAVIQQIIQTSSEEEVVQFIEEFAMDEELREALGGHVSIIDNFIEENIKREG